MLPFILVSPAHADKIQNKVAVFAALDKVTARISKLDVRVGATVQFGSLKVTPRTCYSRPPTEPPKTSAFVDVEEVQLENNETQLFSGWMFAESPGINGVEHPVFDVWLTGCSDPERQISTGGSAAGGQGDDGGGPIRPRRRVQR